MFKYVVDNVDNEFLKFACQATSSLCEYNLEWSYHLCAFTICMLSDPLEALL